MASLTDVTKRVGQATVGATAGTTMRVAGAIGNIATSGIKSVANSATKGMGLGALKPSNMLSATAESLGIGGMLPTISSAMDKIMSKQDKTDKKIDGLATNDPSKSLLESLVGINQSILDNSNKMLSAIIDQNNLLKEANVLTNKQTLIDIENRRESIGAKARDAVPAATGAAGAAGAPKTGFLAGIMGSLNGVLSSLGPLGTFLKSIGSILGTLAKWILRLNPFTLALSAVLLGAEAQDYAMFFENMSKVITDLTEGNFFTAFIRAIGSIGDLVLKGVARLGAKIVNFLTFGVFEDSIAKFEKWLDTFNLADFLLDVVDWISNAFTGLGETIKNGGKFVVEKISTYVMGLWDAVTSVFSSLMKDIIGSFESLASGDIISAVVKFITAIPNAIIQGLGRIVASVIEFFGGDEIAGSIRRFLDNFSLSEMILAPFRYIKDKVFELFGNLQTVITDVLSFDLVGKISESVGSVISGVWNFFKSLPGKALDLISSFIPDSLKSTFKSLFGIKTEEPTPAVTAGGPTKPAPLIEGIGQVKTPANLKTETFDTGSGMGGQQLNVAPVPTSPLIAENVAPVLSAAAQQQIQNVVPLMANRENALNQQSSRMSVSNNATPMPIIVNNVNNVGGGGGMGSSSTPRVSGAVSTTPSTTASDRILFGTEWGDGTP